VDDAMKLIEEGERATWRRMEMIRVQTRISRTLDRILHDYEEDYVRFHQKPLKKKAA
jgi:NTE family protein